MWKEIHAPRSHRTTNDNVSEDDRSTEFCIYHMADCCSYLTLGGPLHESVIVEHIE